MNGDILDRLLNRQVEVLHTLDWADDTFTAILTGYNKDFISFQFAGEVLFIRRSKILWISCKCNAQFDHVQFDHELWSTAFASYGLAKP